MDSVYEIENYSASPNSEDEVKVPNFTKESNSSYEKLLSEALKTTSFEDLTTLQNKIGSKKFEQILQSLVPSLEKPIKDFSQRIKVPKFKKNKPIEISSKKKVSKQRLLLPYNKSKPRDPRFDENCGHHNQDLWEKAYSFLDEYKAKEEEALKKELLKTRNLHRRNELQKILSKKQQEARNKQEKLRKQTFRRNYRKTEAERVRKGKKPFYLKNSEEKKLLLLQKYNELKEKGKLEEYLSKRRQKHASKDRKFVPSERR
ncbi:ribosomal RNA processing protein 36 homolog [Zophobas morio]|uniref:ribosomal RNA processing protein 36 homolog n=1 Tax=Zophobas morio TaxID=2755281 RepID=UPI0030828132